MITISYQQKKNLITLANGLMKNRNKREARFTMACFADAGQHNIVGDPYLTECGSVGCAVGHAPYYGITKMYGEGWDGYSYRTLIPIFNADTGVLIDDRAWRWCFAGEWTNLDDSKKGAAQRIMYFLQYGLPDKWDDVSERDVKLYQNIKGFCPQWLKENT